MTGYSIKLAKQKSLKCTITGVNPEKAYSFFSRQIAVEVKTITGIFLALRLYTKGSKLFIMKKMLLLFTAVAVFFTIISCMKYRCYECRDQNYEVVAKGCDKKAADVETLALERGWNCNVLPD